MFPCIYEKFKTFLTDPQKSVKGDGLRIPHMEIPPNQRSWKLAANGSYPAKFEKLDQFLNNGGGGGGGGGRSTIVQIFNAWGSLFVKRSAESNDVFPELFSMYSRLKPKLFLVSDTAEQSTKPRPQIFVVNPFQAEVMYRPDGYDIDFKIFRGEFGGATDATGAAVASNRYFLRIPFPNGFASSFIELRRALPYSVGPFHKMNPEELDSTVKSIQKQFGDLCKKFKLPPDQTIYWMDEQQREMVRAKHTGLGLSFYRGIKRFSDGRRETMGDRLPGRNLLTGRIPQEAESKEANGGIVDNENSWWWNDDLDRGPLPSPLRPSINIVPPIHARNKNDDHPGDSPPILPFSSNRRTNPFGEDQEDEDDDAATVPDDAAIKVASMKSMYAKYPLLLEAIEAFIHRLAQEIKLQKVDLDNFFQSLQGKLTKKLDPQEFLCTYTKADPPLPFPSQPSSQFTKYTISFQYSNSRTGILPAVFIDAYDNTLSQINLKKLNDVTRQTINALKNMSVEYPVNNLLNMTLWFITVTSTSKQATRKLSRTSLLHYNFLFFLNMLAEKLGGKTGKYKVSSSPGFSPFTTSEYTLFIDHVQFVPRPGSNWTFIPPSTNPPPVMQPATGPTPPPLFQFGQNWPPPGYELKFPDQSGTNAAFGKERISTLRRASRFYRREDRKSSKKRKNSDMNNPTTNPVTTFTGDRRPVRINPSPITSITSIPSLNEEYGVIDKMIEFFAKNSFMDGNGKIFEDKLSRFLQDLRKGLGYEEDYNDPQKVKVNNGNNVMFGIVFHTNQIPNNYPKSEVFDENDIMKYSSLLRNNNARKLRLMRPNIKIVLDSMNDNRKAESNEPHLIYALFIHFLSEFICTKISETARPIVNLNNLKYVIDTIAVICTNGNIQQGKIMKDENFIAYGFEMAKENLWVDDTDQRAEIAANIGALNTATQITFPYGLGSYGLGSYGLGSYGLGS
jgi:hypothetical protein